MIDPLLAKIYEDSVSLENLTKLIVDEDGNVIDYIYTESELTRKCKEIIKQQNSVDKKIK